MTTVKVRMTQEAIEHLFTRDHLGNRLSIAWGEPDAEGFHEPIISVDYTDNLVTAALTALRARVEGMAAPHDTDGAEMVGTLDRAAVLAAIDEAMPK